MNVYKIIIGILLFALASLEAFCQSRYLQQPYDYNIKKGELDRLVSAERYFEKHNHELSTEVIKYTDSLIAVANQANAMLGSLYKSSHDKVEWMKTWRKEKASNRNGDITFWVVVIFTALVILYLIRAYLKPLTVNKSAKLFLLALTMALNLCHFEVKAQIDSTVYYEQQLLFAIEKDKKRIDEIQKEFEQIKDSVQKHDPETYEGIITNNMSYMEVLEGRQKRKWQADARKFIFPLLTFITAVLFFIRTRIQKRQQSSNQK